MEPAAKNRKLEFNFNKHTKKVKKDYVDSALKTHEDFSRWARYKAELGFGGLPGLVPGPVSLPRVKSVALGVVN